jgi:hypothetical protein
MNGAGAWPGYMVNQYYVEGGKNYPDDTPNGPRKSATCCATSASARPSRWGVDRQRIIDVAWNGIGDPKAATISPQSWHFASPEGQEGLQEVGRRRMRSSMPKPPIRPWTRSA